MSDTRYPTLIILALAAALGLPGAARAGPDAPPQPSRVPAADHSPALESLAARFEVETIDPAGRSVGKSEWYFIRSLDTVETIRPMSGFAEVWEQNGRGDLSLKRIFHADRRVVEYLPGDLRAMRINPAWPVLRSIIDPRIFDELKQTATIELSQGRATVYKGAFATEDIEIGWLENAALPARIIRAKDGYKTLLTLSALHAVPPPDWPRANPSRADGYLALDAADFGDMEGDPFVRKVERLDVGSGIFGALGHYHSQH